MIKTYIKNQSKFNQFNGLERMTMKFMILLDIFLCLHIGILSHI